MYQHHANRAYVAFWVLPLICGWMIGCELEGDDEIVDDDATADDDDDIACPAPLDFEELVQGESYHDGTGSTQDCHEIVVLILESQSALELAYQTYLPGLNMYTMPTGVDFDSRILLLSYAEGCSGAGFRLATNSICLDGSALLVHETLFDPVMYLGTESRVFNVTSVETGEYDDVILDLTVEYLEP